MAHELIFNIGLKVANHEPADQLNKTLLKLINFGQVCDTTVRMGTYNEQPERTLIARLECTASIGSLIRGISVMAEELEQDAIAVEINGVGHLIYRLEWDDVQYPFDAQYFLK